MKVLVFDNYDSFTYNLVHLVEKILCEKVDVVKNDEIDLGKAVEYDRIILSPGPGLPQTAGQLLPLVRHCAGKTSLLGVCLGHQAVAEAFGGRLLNLPEVCHGRATSILITDAESLLFRGMPEKLMAGRYHSWVVDPRTLPDDLQVTAVDEEGSIMAMQHRNLDIHSVQFHPESIMTPDGEIIIRNWLLRG